MKRLTTLLAGFGIAALIAASGCSKKKADDTQAQPVAAKASEGVTAEQAQPVAAGAAAAQPAAKPDEAAPAEPGAAGGMTREQVAETTVTMMDELAAAVTSNQGNCDGMADALQTLIEEKKPLMDQGKEVFRNDPAAKQWFEDNYKAKVVSSMTTMIQGMQGCEGNEKIKKVFAHVNE